MLEEVLTLPALCFPNHLPSPQDQFLCPYGNHGNATGPAAPDAPPQPVHAPLASVFPPHKKLRELLSGHREGAPACDNCPEQDPQPAVVNCPDCKVNLCQRCDQSLHSLRGLFVLC